MPNGTYGGVRGKGAQAKRSRSPTYSIANEKSLADSNNCIYNELYINTFAIKRWKSEDVYFYER